MFSNSISYTALSCPKNAAEALALVNANCGVDGLTSDRHVIALTLDCYQQKKKEQNRQEMENFRKKIFPKINFQEAFGCLLQDNDVLARHKKAIQNFPDSLPNHLYLATSFTHNDPCGEIIKKAMRDAEVQFAKTLLKQIKENNVEGDIVEFGVYTGSWLNDLNNICKNINLNKKIYGFDSFQGLPSLSQYDFPVWEVGQFNANYDDVYKFLDCGNNKNIKLVKGWFRDTFPLLKEEISKICYARIDCDLYEPAKECLEFLTGKLVDGSILVFDDWMWLFTHGEPKAFFEWLPTCGYKFEFLAYNGYLQLYLKVKI